MATSKPGPVAPDLDLSRDSPQILPPLVPQLLPPATTSSLDLEEPTVIFENEESRDLITKGFTHFRDNPFSFLRQVQLHYQGAGWRAYNDIIGQPIFYKGFSEQMKERILKSALLVAKITQLAKRRAILEDESGRFGNEDVNERARRKEKRRVEVEKQLNEVADGIVDGMICKFESKTFIRVRCVLPPLLLLLFG